MDKQKLYNRAFSRMKKIHRMNYLVSFILVLLWVGVIPLVAYLLRKYNYDSDQNALIPEGIIIPLFIIFPAIYLLDIFLYFAYKPNDDFIALQSFAFDEKDTVENNIERIFKYMGYATSKKYGKKYNWFKTWGISFWKFIPFVNYYYVWVHVIKKTKRGTRELEKFYNHSRWIKGKPKD